MLLLVLLIVLFSITTVAGELLPLLLTAVPSCDRLDEGAIRLLCLAELVCRISIGGSICLLVFTVAGFALL